MNDLSDKNCIPCEGGVPPLPVTEREELLLTLHSDWSLINEKNRLQRKLKFQDFKESFALVCEISKMAEQQWHHPDIKFGWGYLEIVIYTHKIQSLVESDFIFAAKVDKLVS